MNMREGTEFNEFKKKHKHEVEFEFEQKNLKKKFREEDYLIDQNKAMKTAENDIHKDLVKY